MAVTTFGVTAAVVRADYFPHLSDFSTDSNPTLATVSRIIDQKAATLEGRLKQESITASAITVATDAAYLWCQATLTLMAAIRSMEAAAQQDPAILKAWRAELVERWTELDDKGYLALGLGTGVGAPSGNRPNGPTHHITSLGISTADVATDASSIDAPFRRDDKL